MNRTTRKPNCRHQYWDLGRCIDCGVHVNDQNEQAWADLSAAGGLPEAQALYVDGEAVTNARRYVLLPTVDSDSKRIIRALLADTDSERQKLREQIGTAIQRLREEMGAVTRSERAYDVMLTAWDDCLKRLRAAEKERDDAKRHMGYLEEQRAIADTRADLANRWRYEADEWREKYLMELVVPRNGSQAAADAFQDGWHAVLKRVREGDTVEELAALAPKHFALTADERYALCRLLELLPADELVTRLQMRVGELGPPGSQLSPEILAEVERVEGKEATKPGSHSRKVTESDALRAQKTARSR
jgi:hypothetical protein